MKYLLNSNDREVKVGDVIPVRFHTETPFGNSEASLYVTVTEENLSTLIEYDIIRKVKTLTTDDCMGVIASKLNISKEEATSLVLGLAGGDFEGPALQLLLKAASEYLNPDVEAVKSLEKVYAFSLIDGKINELQTSDIDNYNYFAYFVSKTQAKQVRKMLRGMFSAMYGEQKNTECTAQ